MTLLVRAISQGTKHTYIHVVFDLILFCTPKVCFFLSNVLKFQFHLWAFELKRIWNISVCSARFHRFFVIIANGLKLELTTTNLHNAE